MNERLIKCLAIDDEPLALHQLAAYIRKVPFLELVAECSSAIEAKRILDEELIDAIFCDINMPDLNGMDFVKSLAAPPLVVFTTAYADYAIEGYKVDAIDYLLKPFGLDEFRKAAQRVRDRLPHSPLSFPREPTPALQSGSPVSPNPSVPATPSPAEEGRDREFLEPEGGDGTLFVKTDGRVVRINIADITYVEGMSEYLKIHLDGLDADGRLQKPLVILFSMKRLEERLPNHFMRIHRSYLVNLKKIQEVNKNRVIMDRDTYLPIGDLYRDAFNAYINQNFLGK